MLLAYLCLSAAYTRGVLTNSSPVFPMSSKWRRKVLENSRLFSHSIDRRVLGSFGSRFFSPRVAQLLQTELMSVLVTFRQIAFRLECVIDKTSVATIIEADFLVLWGYQTLSLKSSSDESSSIQSTLRLTLFVHAYTRIWNVHGMRCTGTLVNTLKKTFLTHFLLFKRALQTYCSGFCLWVA